MLTNDNDFDANGRLVDTGVPSRMFTFTVR